MSTRKNKRLTVFRVVVVEANRTLQEALHCRLLLLFVVMYWPEFKQWLRPRDRILADDSLPEYDRRLKHATLVVQDKEALKVKRQLTLGPDYRPLGFTSRLYLRTHFLRKDFERSTAGGTWTKVMSKVWLFRLWFSKRIQHFRYVSTSGPRKTTMLLLFLFGLYLGEYKSYFEYAPGHVHYSWAFMTLHRYHWITPYIIEDTYFKYKPDMYKKDFLEQGLDRLIKEGLEQGETDSLNWLTLGSLYEAQRDLEFAYMCLQMAHYKNHQLIGGNSLQPIDFTAATKFFSK